MSEHELQSRLSRISTIWTLLADADSEQNSRVQSSQMALIQRYQGAVYRYLLGATHDPDVADELFQEFALRFLKGDFRRVDPDRGRFRDYLRTTLVHLVVDHQKRQWKRAQPLDSALAQPEASPDGPAEADRQFIHSWRDDLLARAWTALAEAERQGGQPYYSVLHFRVENPQRELGRNGRTPDRATPARAATDRDRHPQDAPACPAPVCRPADRRSGPLTGPTHARGIGARVDRPRTALLLPFGSGPTPQGRSLRTVVPVGPAVRCQRSGSRRCPKATHIRRGRGCLRRTRRAGRRSGSRRRSGRRDFRS